MPKHADNALYSLDTLLGTPGVQVCPSRLCELDHGMTTADARPHHTFARHGYNAP